MTPQTTFDKLICKLNSAANTHQDIEPLLIATITMLYTQQDKLNLIGTLSNMVIPCLVTYHLEGKANGKQGPAPDNTATVEAYGDASN